MKALLVVSHEVSSVRAPAGELQLHQFPSCGTSVLNRFIRWVIGCCENRVRKPI